MKLKLLAFTLVALACWVLPMKTLAQETDTYVRSNPQALPGVHDSSRDRTNVADTSERNKEDETGVEETKEVNV